MGLSRKPRLLSKGLKPMNLRDDQTDPGFHSMSEIGGVGDAMATSIPSAVSECELALTNSFACIECV